MMSLILPFRMVSHGYKACFGFYVIRSPGHKAPEPHILPDIPKDSFFFYTNSRSNFLYDIYPDASVR